MCTLLSVRCPCRRCVERFDHHCPVLGNCVGAGNHKAFVAFLALMLLSQILFCQVVSSMLTQTYLLQLAAPQHISGSLQAGSRLSRSSSNSGVGESIHTGVQLANGTDGNAATKAAAAAGAAGASEANMGSTAESAQAGESNTLQQATQGNRLDAAGQVIGAQPGRQKSQGLWLTLQALWAAGTTHMGLLLLLFAQVRSAVNAVSWPPGMHGAMQLESTGKLRTGDRFSARLLHVVSAAISVPTLSISPSHLADVAHLVCLQIPTMFMSGFLLFRALALAAANLTVNEWMNRQRYVHLHYTGAGFSNRFDRGIGANCYDFWCGPKFVDYWQLWDAAEQVSNRYAAVSGCAELGTILSLCTAFVALLWHVLTCWLWASCECLLGCSEAMQVQQLELAAVLRCAGLCCVIDALCRACVLFVQEMQRKGMTVLLPWSPTVLVRFWDVRWSKYQQRLASSRERRRELQMQRRMQALGLPAHS